MPYYIRCDSKLASSETWLVTEHEAVNVAVVNPGHGAGSRFEANEGENIWQAIRRQASGWLEPEGTLPFVATDLQMGECYRRMARPRDCYPDEPFGICPQDFRDRYALAMSVGQIGTLLDMLDRICRTVHPAGANLDVFGHDIRNALLLTCMEVETQWRGVLQANGVQGERFTTNQYVRLADALRLREFTVGFPAYPWLEPVAPFQDWGLGSSPSRELPWYEAYQKVKHDRENSFQQGTLDRLFTAIAGCIAMLVAQFGDCRGYMGADLMRHFQVTAWPRWPVTACYVVPRSPYGEKWKSVPYDFGSMHPRRPDHLWPPPCPR